MKRKEIRAKLRHATFPVLSATIRSKSSNNYPQPASSPTTRSNSSDDLPRPMTRFNSPNPTHPTARPGHVKTHITVISIFFVYTSIGKFGIQLIFQYHNTSIQEIARRFFAFCLVMPDVGGKKDELSAKSQKHDLDITVVPFLVR